MRGSYSLLTKAAKQDKISRKKYGNFLMNTGSDLGELMDELNVEPEPEPENQENQGPKARLKRQNQRLWKKENTTRKPKIAND